MSSELPAGYKPPSPVSLPVAPEGAAASETAGSGLSHSMFRIKDPRLSIPFYTQTVGMTLVHRSDSEGGKFTNYCPRALTTCMHAPDSTTARTQPDAANSTQHRTAQHSSPHSWLTECAMSACCGVSSAVPAVRHPHRAVRQDALAVESAGHPGALPQLLAHTHSLTHLPTHSLTRSFTPARSSGCAEPVRQLGSDDGVREVEPRQLLLTRALARLPPFLSVLCAQRGHRERPQLQALQRQRAGAQGVRAVSAYSLTQWHRPEPAVSSERQLHQTCSVRPMARGRSSLVAFEQAVRTLAQARSQFTHRSVRCHMAYSLRYRSLPSICILVDDLDKACERFERLAVPFKKVHAAAPITRSIAHSHSSTTVHSLNHSLTHSLTH